jgi:hypothetical protein
MTEIIQCSKNEDNPLIIKGIMKSNDFSQIDSEKNILFLISYEKELNLIRFDTQKQFFYKKFD